MQFKNIVWREKSCCCPAPQMQQLGTKSPTIQQSDEFINVLVHTYLLCENRKKEIKVGIVVALLPHSKKVEGLIPTAWSWIVDRLLCL